MLRTVISRLAVTLVIVGLLATGATAQTSSDLIREIRDQLLQNKIRRMPEICGNLRNL